MGRRLRVSGSYIYQLESGRRDPGEPLKQVFEMMEKGGEASLNERIPIIAESDSSSGRLIASPAMRMIPVVSMARAGLMTDFEELPIDWQSQIPSDCPDTGAFGIELRGDSMEPRFSNGDIVIVMPHVEPRFHSFVVARLVNGGAVFKLFNADPSQDPPVIRLTSLNPNYEPIVVTGEQLVRCYPVYGVFRKLW